MQVSLETTSSIERRMTIGVPAEKVAQEVNSRLQKTASTVKMNGFRPGKVPFSVVKKSYGPSIRQEVIGELMRNSYVEALTQEKVSPVGYPNFEPKNLEEGQDLEFVAVFEVYPEIELADASVLSVTREVAEIAAGDIDNMIELLRKQQAELKPVERKSQDKDTLTVDYKGSVDGELFDGGSAEDAKIALGSGQMIPGFEEGLIGASAGEEVELKVTFPEEYQSKELAGKDAVFAVTVKLVEEQTLPELDIEFFKKYGVGSETEADFKTEIVKNMERELKQAINNKVKQQIVDGLVEINEFDIPKALAEQEIDRLKEEAIQQFGGQMKASDLPSEIFSAQAEKRVKIGLIFAELVKKNSFEVDDEAVDAKIAELAATYQEPENVIEWYKSQPEQRSQIESVIMEEKVVDFILQAAKVEDKSVSYEEAVKPAAPKVEEAEADEDTSPAEAEQ